MRFSFLLTLVIAVLASCGGGDGPSFGDDHPRIYLERNRERLAAALTAGDPAATRFANMVDSELDGAAPYGFDSWFGALMGQLTGEDRYCDYVVARTDELVASEEALIASGTVPVVAHDSYLQVGPMIGDVMLTYDWCFERISGSQKNRWLAYAAQTIWNVWHFEEARWGGVLMPWTGYATNDPVDNYYFSFLRATMLFGLAAHGEHPDADGWLTWFRDDKIAGELVPFFDTDLVGGGSREGTGYGVSMFKLWELYDLWEASTGERIADLTPHTRASFLYAFHTLVPTRDFIAPIADHSRDSTAAMFDYDRNYMLELMHLYPDDRLVPEAVTMLDTSSVPEMSMPFMFVYDFLYGAPDVTPEPLDGLGRSWYGPGIGELFTRSSWETDATWLSFIAGPYTQGHQHRDQGSFLLYKEGWLAYDPIIDSHSGTYQQEELHNLVRLVGDDLKQRTHTVSPVLALHTGPGWLHVAADTAPAYNDERVQVDHREMVFVEPDCLVVFDRVTTADEVGQVWQLNAPTRPEISGNRATIPGTNHDLQVDRIGGDTPVTSVFDWTEDPDQTGGFRLDETLPGGAHTMLHVLSIAGTVTAATASDADGRTGVAITFADGRTATVRFGATGVDGTLEVNGPSGDISETLDEGIDSLPE
jgi:hypothetical protein